jgi:ADP-ribose pyrophosphatase YjhB (NUDIX family)
MRLISWSRSIELFGALAMGAAAGYIWYVRRQARTCGRLIPRSAALAMPGAKQACHVAIWAPVKYQLWGTLPAGHAVLMQMRFDGLLGFPGGLVDIVDGHREDLSVAATRELAEELSANVVVSDGDYLGCIYLPDQHLCTHLYEKRVTEAMLSQLERDALTAYDRFEVCGTLRCPCYGLPATANGGVSNKGFGLFIQQRFAGNAKQQLLRLVKERGLVDQDVFKEAVARAGVKHLLAY